MAALLPPMPPIGTAEQVTQFWATNTGLKQCGLVPMLAGSALPVPFSTLIAARMKQLEGRFTPLTYAQIIGAPLSVVAIVLPVYAFAAAVALFKVRLIGINFMELRVAPAPGRLLFEGYLLIVFAMLTALNLTVRP